MNSPRDTNHLFIIIIYSHIINIIQFLTRYNISQIISLLIINSKLEYIYIYYDQLS